MPELRHRHARHVLREPAARPRRPRAVQREVLGPGQRGLGPLQITKEDYAKKAAQWAKALRLLDPDVRAARPARAPGTTTCSTGASAGSTCTASTSTRRPATHVKNATAPLAAERAIQISAGLINLARIENGISPDGTARQDLLRLDEWNVWDPERASGDKGAEEQNTLSDGQRHQPPS